MNRDRLSLSYLAWFFFSVLAFSATFLLLSAFFEPIAGDLTRVGRWSERDFGWNHPQPFIPLRANGPSLTDPDVLVLGDSYSASNVWQSYLAESRNLKILSFSYPNIGCIDNWLRWVANRPYPTISTVVIETAERNLVPLFRKISACADRAPIPFEIAAGNIYPTRFRSSLTQDVTYLFLTAINTLRLALDHGRIASAGVINVPLTNDRLFSNHQAHRLLYYVEDEDKRNWTKEHITTAVENLLRIQKDFAKNGLRLIVIVVPDKSSAYRQYLSLEEERVGYPDVFQQLDDAGVNSVNLFKFFQQAIQDTVDLYNPNDTHLSAQGSRMMAAKVAALF